MNPVTVAAIVLAVCSAAFCCMTWRAYRRIATLQRQLATALGIIGERDDSLKEYDARNERLHRDMQAMRDRLLPQLTPLAVDEDVTRAYVRDEAYDPWEEVR